MPTDAKKVRLFEVISRAEVSERIPRVVGAFHFALPFVGDDDADWAGALVDHTYPRAILISRHLSGPKAGQVYPTSIAPLLAAAVPMPTDDQDPGYAAALAAYEADQAARQAVVNGFLGVLIDGFDYSKDLNITVTLAAGIPQIYLQTAPGKPHSTVDADLVTVAAALGFKIFNGQVFWNKVQ
jgi:hypothetical protein